MDISLDRRSAAGRLCIAGIGLALAASLLGCTGLQSLISEEGWDAARADKHREALLRAKRDRDSAETEADEGVERKTAAELLREGDRLRHSGDTSKAAVVYLRAHHADKSELAPLRRIAYLALESEPAQAAELFGDLIEKSPDAADLHLGLAMARLAGDELEAALVSATRAQELDPDEPVIREAAGVVYDRLGRHDEAQTAYQGALDKGGPAPRLLNNLGVSQMLAGDRDGAIESFRRALARGARDSSTANNLGLVLGLEGRYDEAYAQFAKHGTKGDAFNNLGYAAYLRGDYDAAKRSYEKALLANDTDELRVLQNLKVLEQSHREGRLPTPPARRSDDAAALP